jgi:hypothetical protein
MDRVFAPRYDNIALLSAGAKKFLKNFKKSVDNNIQVW